MDKARRLGCCQVVFINPAALSATPLGACSRGGGLHWVNAQGRDTKVALGTWLLFLLNKASHFCPSRCPCQKQPKTLPKQRGGKCASAAPNPIHEELSAAVLASRGMAGRSPSRVLLQGVSPPPTTNVTHAFTRRASGAKYLLFVLLRWMTTILLCPKGPMQGKASRKPQRDGPGKDGLVAGV